MPRKKPVELSSQVDDLVEKRAQEKRPRGNQGWRSRSLWRHSPTKLIRVPVAIVSQIEAIVGILDRYPSVKSSAVEAVWEVAEGAEEYIPDDWAKRNPTTTEPDAATESKEQP